MYHCCIAEPPYDTVYPLLHFPNLSEGDADAAEGPHGNTRRGELQRPRVVAQRGARACRVLARRQRGHLALARFSGRAQQWERQRQRCCDHSVQHFVDRGLRRKQENNI
mgnify:CR=1 FL=1